MKVKSLRGVQETYQTNRTSKRNSTTTATITTTSTSNIATTPTRRLETVPEQERIHSSVESRVIENPYAIMPRSKRFSFCRLFQRSSAPTLSEETTTAATAIAATATTTPTTPTTPATNLSDMPSLTQLIDRHEIKSHSQEQHQPENGSTITTTSKSTRKCKENNNNSEVENLGRKHGSDTDLVKTHSKNKIYRYFQQQNDKQKQQRQQQQHQQQQQKQQQQQQPRQQHKQHQKKKSQSSSCSSRRSSSESSTNISGDKDSPHPHAMMFYAVQYKDLDLLEQLITTETDFGINDLNEDGIAVIHFAAMIGSTECMNILAKFGADINMEDIRGNPPLHYAFLMKKYEFIGALLEKGARTNLLSKHQFPELKTKNKRMTWFRFSGSATD